jgi:hypothetical protein
MALKDGLKLFLRLNEPSGTTVVDYGPSGFPVTISGTDQRTLVAGQTGTNRNAVFMNTGFYFAIADNSIFDLTGASTIRFKVNTSYSGSQYIVSKTNSTFDAGYEAFITNGDPGYVQRPLGLNYQPVTDVSGSFKDVIFRVNMTGSTVAGQVFINGVLTSFAGGASWVPANSAAPLAIGARAFDGAARFSGAIQDVTIYNRPLSDAEIMALSTQHYSTTSASAVVRDNTTDGYNFGLGTGTYYKIIGGADSGLFNISDAGNLTFNSPVSASSPTDSDRDSRYEVTVMLFSDTTFQDVSLSISPYAPTRISNVVVRAGRGYAPALTTGLVPDSGVVANLNDRFDDYYYYTCSG